MAVITAIKGEIKGVELAEVVAAVANAGGGEIHIDLNPDEIDVIVRQAVQHIAPQLFPVILPVSGGASIAVPDGPDKPYMVAGKFPVLENEHIRYLTVSEIERMILDRWMVPTFDARIMDSLSIDSLDRNLVEQFARRLDEVWLVKLLERMGLLRGGKLTVAAVLMFGLLPESYFPQAEVKVNRRRSFSDTELLTSKRFLGPIMEKFSNINRYVLTEANQLFERSKVACFQDCLEELIANAFMHRDYSVPALLEISISPEGIAIFSPGCPPTPDFPAKKGAVPSFPRNPLLRRAMYAAGIARPSPGWALLRARAKECGVDGITMDIRWGGLLFTIPIGKKMVDIEQLNPRQRELYKYLLHHKVITRREYEEMMGISERTARLDLEEMVKAGILKREGRGKQIRYVLNV